MSIATHVALIGAVAIALGSGHHHHDDEPPPARLVWVEPARAPRIAPSAPESIAPAPAPPPSAPELQSPPHIDANPAAPPAAALTHRETRPRPRIERPRAVAPAPDAAEKAPAPAEVIAAGREGAVATGIPGGAPGGLAAAPLPLSTVATPPEIVERIVPEYPAGARQLEIEGQVMLEVVLDQGGRPEESIRVLKSVAMLDAAAIAAVRQWRFRPARDASGRAVRVIMEVPVRFMLR